MSVLGGETGFWGKMRTGQRVSRLGPRRRRDGGRVVRVVAGSWKRVPKSFFSGRKILAEFPPFLMGGKLAKSCQKPFEVGGCWRGGLLDELAMGKLGSQANKMAEPGGVGENEVGM